MVQRGSTCCARRAVRYRIAMVGAKCCIAGLVMPVE